MTQHRASFRKRGIPFSTIFLMIGVTRLFAVDLMWGPGGTGGDGAWDTANWWDGSQNGAWQSGARAIFSGTGGTVTSFYLGPTVSGMVFNAPGYVIDDGMFELPGSSFEIEANQDVEIRSVFSERSGTSLVKTGSGILTVSSFNFISNVFINEGEYRVGQNSTPIFLNVSLADAPGVVLTIPVSESSIRSLSGGGLSGGVVRPADSPGVAKLALTGSGTFAGTFQDNGAGKLRINVFGSNASVVLTNANTYSGETSVKLGTLVFSGGGSALNSSFISVYGQTLRLDNSELALSNRLSDSANLRLNSGGIFEFVGNGDVAVEEHLGELSFSGGAAIKGTKLDGTLAQVTFAAGTRIAHGTLQISGDAGVVSLGGLGNESSGIVKPYVTFGKDWAVVGAGGRLEPFTDYVPDINEGGAGTHVKILGGGTTQLVSDSLRASLILDNDTEELQTLDLNDKMLDLTTGGLMSAGDVSTTISGGALRTAADEWVVTNQGNLTIEATIQEMSPGTGLTKSGSGTLILAGSNMYSGPTSIVQGTLVVFSDANLGTGSLVGIHGGTLKAGGSFSSEKGILNLVSYAGTIDTNGFDVRFSGGLSGGISKYGEGTLFLDTISAESTLHITSGILEVYDISASRVSLTGGTLRISGSTEYFYLSSGMLSPVPVLDIGGSSAGNFTSRWMTASFAQLILRWDIGSEAGDLWTIDSPLPFLDPYEPSKFLFDFSSLGGLQLGNDYTLINMPNNYWSLDPRLFAFSPESIAAGWSGEFITTPEFVKVRFYSIPEPGGSVWIAMALLGLGLRKKALRRQRARNHQGRGELPACQNKVV